jgi:hypothetical protein
MPNDSARQSLAPLRAAFASGQFRSLLLEQQARVAGGEFAGGSFHIGASPNEVPIDLQQAPRSECAQLRAIARNCIQAVHFICARA